MCIYFHLAIHVNWIIDGGTIPSERGRIHWVPLVVAKYDGVYVARAGVDSKWERQPKAPMGSTTGLSREEIELRQVFSLLVITPRGSGGTVSIER